MTTSVPVALFAYRRPDLLSRSLESLRANGVPLIYAFSDGARDPSQESDVAEVRRLLRAVQWARVDLVEHPTNVGVSANIIGGVSQVLAQFERVFVCEEDIAFVLGTYAWICAALTHYASDERVMGVTAWNHPRVTPSGAVTEPYFSGRSTSLIWGTWRRAWTGMPDRDCAALLALCRERGIDVEAYGDDNVDAARVEHAYGMWDHRFNLHMLAQRGLFLWPARSMGEHIGYDSRATNSPNGAGWENSPSPAPDAAAERWPPVVEHPGAGEPWRRTVNAPPPPSVLERVSRRMGRLFGS